jgi:hypothetical protein
LAVFAALCANASSKWVLAVINGTRELALWLGGGAIIMLLLGIVLLLM